MTKQTNGGWLEQMPQLAIELLEDGTIRLENEDPSGNGPYSVDLHPMHLRFIAEKMGLVREMSASDADIIRTLRGQHADAVWAVQTLVRRMRKLQERIDHIQMWLCTHSDTRHTDLSYEMDYTTATSELCEEFFADLDHIVGRAGNACSVTEVTPASATSNAPSVSPALAESDGPRVESPARTQSVSGKACANPSGKASAKASVKPSGPGTESLFGGEHD